MGDVSVKHKFTILLVEDAAAIRHSIKHILEAMDYRVIEAEDGVEAISVANFESVDLILMDISLPVMDGVAATRCIRKIDRLREIPIVAFSGYDKEMQGPALASGFSDYLIKDEAVELLPNMLNRLLLASA